MANSNQSLSAKLSERYAGLTDREQTLVVAMGVVMPILAVALVVILFGGVLDDIAAQTRSYEAVLDTIAADGPEYMRQKNGAQETNKLASRFTDDVMTNNPVSLTSFIASKAETAGVDVASYNPEEIPLGSKSGDKSGSMVVEKRVKADIREVPHDKLLEFLEAIETSDEPVVIMRVKLNAHRRDAGKVSADVYVSTFVKRDQKS